jgi:hypothetical protein
VLKQLLGCRLYVFIAVGLIGLVYAVLMSTR